MTILVISDHGSYLGKEKEQFKISFGMSDKPISYVPALKVRGILVDAKISISSGAFSLIRTYGIPVFWQEFNDDGMLLIPFNNHGSVEVRKAQYFATLDSRAVYVSAKLVYAACYNKIVVLKRLGRRGLDSSELFGLIKKMEKKLNEFTNDKSTYGKLDLELRIQFMNVEAVIAKYYYQGISLFLEMYNWEFKNRSRRPANDFFNSLLNYLYAVLKGQITQFITISGLDIFCGFLHTDRSGRESLVLDIMEEFRQIAVDELLFNLIVSGNLSENDFGRQNGEDIEITPEVKQIILPGFFSRLNIIIKNTRLQTWMVKQPQNLSNYLRGFSGDYHPFLMEVGGSFQ